MNNVVSNSKIHPLLKLTFVVIGACVASMFVVALFTAMV